MKGFPKTVSILALPLFIEEVPRRGDGEGEQRRSWNTILLLKLKLGNQKASALRGWNLKFKI